LTLSEWTNLAIVFLAAQVFIMGIGGAIGLFYTIRSFNRLDKEMRFRLPLLREQMKQTAVSSYVIAEYIREPIIAASSGWAQAGRIVSGFASSFKRK
jgi:hypothetical protein